VKNNSQLSTVNSQLPKGWAVKKLGDIGKVSMCKRILKKQTSSIGDIPFYKIGTFGKTTNAFISKEVYEEYCSKYSFPKKGDILLSASGTIGRRVIYDGKPAYFQDSNIVWIDNDEKEVLNDYLYKFYGFCDWNPSKGATIPRLYNNDLRRIEIPIPSLPEQQRIVKILDKAFVAIDKAKQNAEQNLRNAKEVFENSLQLLFDNKDWKYENLGKIASFKNGMNFTKSSNGQSVEIVGVKNFKNNFWVPFQELEEVVIDGKFNETYLLKEGDIITVRSNGNPKLIGRTLLADSVIGNITHSGFTIRIRLNPNTLLPLFLCHYLKTQKTRKELIDSGNGVGIKSLNQGSLSSLMIPLPKSKDEQQQIVKKLNKLSDETKKLEAIYQQKIKDLEELKKSILQKAFNGGL